MGGSAQETAIGGTIGAFEDNRPRKCKTFGNPILMVIFEIDYAPTRRVVVRPALSVIFAELELKYAKRYSMISLLGSC